MPAIDFAQVFSFFLVLVFSLTVHEAAHAWSADRLGDPTARLLGRVSLNPAVHIDPIGTIVFPLIAIATNLPLIGWAKPVPVDIPKLRRHWRQKFMMIAAAGPASNLVLATVAAIVLRVLQPGDLEPNAVIEVGTPIATLLETRRRSTCCSPSSTWCRCRRSTAATCCRACCAADAADLFDRLRPYGFLILYGLMLTGMLLTHHRAAGEFPALVAACEGPASCRACARRAGCTSAISSAR